MAYDEFLLERITQILEKRKVDFYPKKMMGGIVFMVNEKMCVCIDVDKNTGEDRMLARIGEEEVGRWINKRGSRVMDYTGRPMKGYVFVGPEGFDMDEDLEFWVDKALDFNPFAKTSKKRKPKK